MSPSGLHKISKTQALRVVHTQTGGDKGEHKRNVKRGHEESRKKGRNLSCEKKKMGVGWTAESRQLRSQGGGKNLLY